MNLPIRIDEPDGRWLRIKKGKDKTFTVRQILSKGDKVLKVGEVLHSNGLVFKVHKVQGKGFILKVLGKKGENDK